jgi:putative alpha-1,2-mannosidase
MSAWYLFSMLGFYPVDPAAAKYVLAAPFFDYARLELDNDRAVEVRAPGASEGMKYVKSVRINGREWDKIEVPHSMLVDGVEIVFEMSYEPGRWPEA